MSNQSAIGYMILAARQYGLKQHEIEILEQHMRIAMDEYTEEEAEEVYRKS